MHKASEAFFVRTGRQGCSCRSGRREVPHARVWTNNLLQPSLSLGGRLCRFCARTARSSLVPISPVTAGRVEYRAGVWAGPNLSLVRKYLHARGRCGPFEGCAPNPEEVEEVRWAAIGTLEDEIAIRPEAFTPWLRIYLAQHSDMIFGARTEA